MSTQPSIDHAASAARANDTVLGDTELQSEVLESNAEAVNYHEWLCSMALPYLGDNPLEIGSGLGDYAQTWLEMGVPRVTVTEADPSRLAHLKEKFQDESRIALGSIDLDATVPGNYSAAVSFNVMEHIPDDVAALRAARCAVRDDGAVISFVPAFPFAMSKFDRAIGHVRRYTVDSLSQAYAQAGLELETIRYVNAPGLLAWFIGMRLLRMTPKAGPTVSVWDAQVVPRARRWESRHRVPFGQSVFAVGRPRPRS